MYQCALCMRRRVWVRLRNGEVQPLFFSFPSKSNAEALRFLLPPSCSFDLEPWDQLGELPALSLMPMMMLK